MRETRFNIYRYQILPITQYQMNLFDAVLSVDELKARKNEFFLESLVGLKKFDYGRAELNFKIHRPTDDIIMLRLGANRGAKIETKDFERDIVDNWPSALVVFDNHPQVQKIAIEIEYKSFRSTATIAEVLDRNLNNALAKYNLYISLQPLFDKNRFWNVVEKYPQRITETEFRMISPNMSNISDSLKVDLAEWNKITNTQETIINLKSDKNTNLTFAEGDEPVTSLVDYASLGGGNIKIKVRGLNRKISTNDKVTEVSVKDLEIDFEPEKLSHMGDTFRKLLEE